MQLTQKAKKLEFKTKDSTLSRINSDGEVSASYCFEQKLKEDDLSVENDYRLIKS
jgi:hypothetical protein